MRDHAVTTLSLSLGHPSFVLQSPRPCSPSCPTMPHPIISPPSPRGSALTSHPSPAHDTLPPDSDEAPELPAPLPPPPHGSPHPIAAREAAPDHSHHFVAPDVSAELTAALYASTATVATCGAPDTSPVSSASARGALQSPPLSSSGPAGAPEDSRTCPGIHHAMVGDSQLAPK